MKNIEQNKIFKLKISQTISRYYQIPFQIDSIYVHQQITHKTWLIGTQHTRPIEMVLGGLHQKFYVNILIFFSSHQNDSKKPFFVIDTGNVFTWLTVIHKSCLMDDFLCKIVTSSDETCHI